MSEFNWEAYQAAKYTSKIEAALEALPRATYGDWWCSYGELHNDPVGSIKIARGLSGGNKQQEEANIKLICAARELAAEVIKLRAELKTPRAIDACDANTFAHGWSDGVFGHVYFHAKESGFKYSSTPFEEQCERLDVTQPENGWFMHVPCGLQEPVVYMYRLKEGQ